MLRTAFLFLLAISASGLSAQSSPSQNMALLGTWDDPALPRHSSAVRYSDVWGYARDGREYALLGSYGFVHIIDVTDPGQPTEITALNVFTNSGSIWRDIKVMGDYAYCVTETTEGMQVIDLSNLPTSASIVFHTQDFFRTCHNIFIDESASPPRLYAFGATKQDGGQSSSIDVLILSLANPAVPTVLAEINIDNPDLPSVGYMHDGYVRNDTLYANHGYSGMYVYDLTDPQNPEEVGSLTSYAESGYNHSVWATEDGRHLVMCDENTDLGVKVVSVDKSDPFAVELEVESIFRSTSLAPNMASIAHNPYVLGDSLVVLSYYGEGLQIWDITDPQNPVRRAYYDTTPNSSSYTDGVWGAYPWLPSGNLLASDMRYGLFVLRHEQSATLPVTYTEWAARSEGKNVHLNWSTEVEDQNAGWTVEHAASDGAFARIGWVPASGGAYTFVHPTPGSGVHFYRLRQRDLGGQETLSEVRSVTLEGEAIAPLVLYPNPAPAAAPVTLSDAVSGWELLTLDGRLLNAGTGAIPTQGLPTGVYLVRTEEQTARLVVE